jgi:tetratricopeptide (TPR) repeat protein
LIDAETSAHLWADRFDGDLSSLPDLRDAVATRVTRSLSFELPAAENRRSLLQRPDNPDAMDYVLRSPAIINRNGKTKEDYIEARHLAEAALRLDPGNNEALIRLADADVRQVLDYLSDNRVEQLHRAEEEVDRALYVAPDSADAHYLKGNVLLAEKKIVAAISEYETTLRLDPNAVLAYARIGQLEWYAGRPEDTFKYIEEARRRSPKDRSIPLWHYWAGSAHLWLGHLDAAIDEYRRGAAGAPGWGLIPLNLTCVYGLAGREQEARAAFADTDRLLPNFTIAKWKENSFSDDPIYLAGRERCYDVVRKLGMPEQ